MRSTSAPLRTTWCTGATSDTTSIIGCGLPRRWIFLAGVALIDAQRLGEAPAAAAGRRDDLEMLRSRVLEHHRLGRFGDSGGKVGHGDRPGMDLGFADRDQAFGEIPQPELVEVGGAVAGLGGLEHFAILAERFRPLNRQWRDLRPGRCLC